MKYPTSDQYEYFERFRQRWILDEPSDGYYVARPRGALMKEYSATKSVPGIKRVEHGAAGDNIFKDKNRPIYCRSLTDFGWKLMCYLMKEGELEP